MRHLSLRLIKWLAFSLSFLTVRAQSTTPQRLYEDSVYLRIPTKSQFSEVKQIIGVSDVTVSYFRPNVEGRKIFGHVVKYNSVWGAGAEHATKFHFHDAPIINGHEIPSGDYAFFVIPKDSVNWVIIFNRNPNQHNTVHYKDEENVLELNVKAKESPFCESLTYSIRDIKENSAIVRLAWENKMIEFNISFNEQKLIWDNIEKYVAKSKILPDSIWWHDYLSIGNYCLYTKNRDKVNYAISLVDKTFDVKENFENLKMKSDLLALKGDYKDANAYAIKAKDNLKYYKMPVEMLQSIEDNIKRYEEILSKAK